MTMFRTVSGALTIYAGDPRPVHFPFFDAAGAPQSLSGRSFVFAVRREILTQAIFDPIPMILSNDGYYVTAPITADQATAIYEAGVGYPIVYDVIETTAGASTTRWTGRIAAQPSTALPSDAPPRWIDLPVAELVSDGPVVRVSERGAAGPGVEQRLKDLGDIAEADPALMRDKIREWGGEGGAPFAEAAEAAAQQAAGLVEPVQAIADFGGNAVQSAGRDFSFNPSSFKLQGMQRLVGAVNFKSSWEGTLDELMAAIDDPVAEAQLVDDAPRFVAAVHGAAALGCRLVYDEPIYFRTTADVNCGVNYPAKILYVQCQGDGKIVGAPTLPVQLLYFRNSSTQPGAMSNSVELWLDGVDATTEKVPGDPFSAHDCVYATGFSRKRFIGCKLKVADHYLDATGDSCLFTVGDDVAIIDCEFRGSRDLGVYLSGNAAGNANDSTYLMMANKYYYCRNAWKGSRNSRNIISVGDHLIGCVNGPACPAPSSNWDGMVGFNVVCIGTIFENMVSRCFDTRNSRNWDCSGFIVYGTLGIEKNGNIDPAATVVSLTGTTNSRFQGVVNVTGSHSNNSIIRIAALNSIIGAGNKVDIVATNSNIGYGVLEVAGNDNDISLKCGPDVAIPYSTVGANTRVEWSKNGERGVILGGIDVTPGRVQFGAIRTASTVLTAVPLARMIRVQTSSSVLDMTLPEGRPGDRVGFMKWPGSTDKFVNIRNPAGTTMIRLRDIGDYVWFTCEVAGAWTIENRYLSTFDRLVPDSTIVTASGSLSGTLTGRIIDVQPPSTSTIDAVLWNGAAAGDTAIVRKAAGSGSGAVAVKNGAGTTIQLLRDIGDIIILVSDGANGWSVVSTMTARLSAVVNGRLILQEMTAAQAGTAPAGCQILFIDSVDHVPKRKDSSGAVAVV
ncbi:MAG: hypothetical protein CML23_14535 [Rhizobiaceae bacterium]|nr:hypothetical protein [Rhizobiaceae bacterium]